MRTLAEALASFVPSRIVARLAAGESCAPFAERFPAALLFADISDSTALAERLAEQGPAGAEELSRLLNTYLGALVDEVTSHGGDVVKFAGDGLLALWPAADDGLAVATQHAAQCALSVQQTLQGLGPDEDVRLSVCIGVGAGEVTGLALGSPADRMEFLIVGEPVAQTCRAERGAQRGEVVITTDAWRAIETSSTGVPLPSGGVRLTHVRPLEPVSLAATSTIDDNALAALRAYAPPAIVARLSAGQDEWLAELRHVTILFVRLADWSVAGACDAPLVEAQALVSALEAIATRYAGAMVRLGVDDDGPVAQFAFGAPPLAHEDDPARGVQAALALQAALRAHGVRAGIGITTGRAFCGAVGGARRREYAIVGDAVNVAARLMQAAGAEILCDAATAEACRDRVGFALLPPIVVKGKADPIRIFRPRGTCSATVRPRPDLVGRTVERAELRQQLHQLITARTGAGVVIEGGAGIGKSRLVGELRAQAHALGVAALLGGSDAIEGATPYHAWRSIIGEMFGLDAQPDDRATRRTHLLARINALSGQSDGPANPSLHHLAPLLNAVLSLGIEENEQTAPMSGEARADNLHELIVGLLQRMAAARPLVVILEDAHWMDSASWAVTLLARQRIAQLLLIVVTRPPGNPPPVEYRRFVHAPGTQHLQLDGLPPEEGAALVCQRLGVTRISPPVRALIQERTGGNPFFIEELAYALRDAGVITTTGDECRLAMGASAQSLPLPRTLHGAITSRVDHLTLRQQLTIKVASVLGQSFSLETLRDVHPIDADKACLAEDLAMLEQLDFIRADGTAPATGYTFKHAVIQQVVYDQLAFSQRRQLHRAAGEWYERTCGTDPTLFAALRAHHWSHALDAQHPEAPLVARAIDAAERAGEQAGRNYAHREAVGFFEAALRLQPMHSITGAAARRRASWERQLGEAYYRLGQAADADAHLRASLTLLGHHVPSTNLGFALSTARESVRQLAHRLLPRLFVGRARSAARDDMRQAARANEILGVVWFLTMKPVPMLLANLRCLNLAEAAGPSAEMASGCAMMALLGGMFFGPRVAAHYFELGLETARQVSDRYGLGRLQQSQGFYFTGQGQWADAEAALEGARNTFAQLGDTRWQEMATLTLGNTHQMHRRYADSLPLYAAAHETSAQRGDGQAQAWAVIGTGGALHAIGRHDEALQVYDAMASGLANSFEQLSDRGSEFSVCGLRALAHWRRGEWALARQDAERARRISAQSPLLIYYALPGYTSLAEVSLRLWERGITEHSATCAADARLARQAVADLRHFARFFPIGQPQASLWQGFYCWLRGHRRRAQAAWQHSLALAAQLDMPHDLGLAHYEIGRHLPVGADAHARHLHQACELFSYVGARYDLQCARAALDMQGPAALDALSDVAARSDPSVSGP